MLKMNTNNFNLTLLSERQIWGNDTEPQLEVMKKYGTKAAITDLCILTGGHLCNIKDFSYNIDEDSSLKGRTGCFLTRSSNGHVDVRAVNRDGTKSFMDRSVRSGAIRPVLRSSAIFSQISTNRVRGYNGTEEVEYGEYPQYAVSSEMQDILEAEYTKGKMNETGGSYTFDSVKYPDWTTGFKPVVYKEYAYQGKKYIRIKASSSFMGLKFELSNECLYKDGDYVWVEVSPVKWLIDNETESLIAKTGLVSGIRFLDENHYYKGDFSKTAIKEYLDKYMAHDLTQSLTSTRVQDITAEEKVQSEVKSKQNKLDDFRKNAANEILTERQLDKYNTDLQEQERIEDIITRLNTEISDNGISITRSSSGELIQTILEDYNNRRNKLHYDLLPIKELVSQYQMEKNKVINECVLGDGSIDFCNIDKVVEPITKKYREMAMTMENAEEEVVSKKN